ncbi:MAG: hypothetical protein ACD_50C00381G0003 [uncultured bacterium]|nr:MAG: hypothetical protein ACD_50C00381G0003 [uncultured bacterium]KKQ80825.1 MAG: hypothetical protein UT02_C0002G0050 [Parcubacteria group bacterium GW2011_GWC2_38_7]
MTKIKRKWDSFLSDKKRKTCIDEIITFYKEKQDESIGFIKAGEILDFVLQVSGETIYNKGIEDARNLLKNRWENLEIDLDLLINK